MENKQQIAEKTVDFMRGCDPLSTHFQFQIIKVTPNAVELKLTVCKWMLNGHGTCHGGVLFSLADSAFQYSANACNRRTVGQSCSIDYIKPAKLGDVLTTKTVERSRGKRTSYYDISIYNQNDELICLFKGQAVEVGGAIYE